MVVLKINFNSVQVFLLRWFVDLSGSCTGVFALKVFSI